MWNAFKIGRLPVNNYGYQDSTEKPETVPIEFRDRTWADFSPKLKTVIDAWLVGKSFSGDIFTNMMFRGSPGNGKSSAAWLTIVEFLATQGVSRVYNVSFEEMMKTFSSAEGYDEFSIEKIKRWHSSKLLIIDDFGTRDPKSSARIGQLFNLLNSRHENRRKTLISCNVPDEWIVANCDGDRTLDRIKGLVIKFTQPSFRKTAEITI